MAEKTLYAERDIMEQGEHYARHVDAMTAERLHAKSDIAAELAHRDIEIDRLTARLSEARGLLDRYRRICLRFTEGGAGIESCDCLQCSSDRFLAATEPKP